MACSVLYLVLLGGLDMGSSSFPPICLHVSIPFDVREYLITYRTAARGVPRIGVPGMGSVPFPNDIKKSP